MIVVAVRRGDQRPAFGHPVKDGFENRRVRRVAGGDLYGEIAVVVGTPEIGVIGSEVQPRFFERRDQHVDGVGFATGRPDDPRHRNLAALKRGKGSVLTTLFRDVAAHAARALPVALFRDDRHRRRAEANIAAVAGPQPDIGFSYLVARLERRRSAIGCCVGDETRCRRPDHLVGLISQRFSRRHEDEHAVGIRFPGKISGNFNDIFKAVARFRQRVHQRLIGLHIPCGGGFRRCLGLGRGCRLTGPVEKSGEHCRAAGQSPLRRLQPPLRLPLAAPFLGAKLKISGDGFPYR